MSMANESTEFQAMLYPVTREVPTVELDGPILYALGTTATTDILNVPVSNLSETRPDQTFPDYSFSFSEQMLYGSGMLGTNEPAQLRGVFRAIEERTPTDAPEQLASPSLPDRTTALAMRDKLTKLMKPDTVDRYGLETVLFMRALYLRKVNHPVVQAVSALAADNERRSNEILSGKRLTVLDPKRVWKLGVEAMLGFDGTFFEDFMMREKTLFEPDINGEHKATMIDTLFHEYMQFKGINNEDIPKQAKLRRQRLKNLTNPDKFKRLQDANSGEVVEYSFVDKIVAARRKELAAEDHPLARFMDTIDNENIFRNKINGSLPNQPENHVLVMSDLRLRELYIDLLFGYDTDYMQEKLAVAAIRQKTPKRENRE